MAPYGAAVDLAHARWEGAPDDPDPRQPSLFDP
jgi:hypothetical protein